MKGMGMDMKMGLYMKMDMDNMQGMGHGNMQGMDHGNMPMDTMNQADHPAMDRSGMPMDSMDHSQMNRGDTTTHQHQDTMDMKSMDHSKMPGMQKPPAKKKPAVTTTKKPIKAPVKKAATPKKTTPPKKAPKKKDPMEGMDHSKHGGMSYVPAKALDLDALVFSDLGEQNTRGFGPSLQVIHTEDTIPTKSTQRLMQGHDMHQMKMDTVPKKEQPPMNLQPMKGQNMQHGNTDMGGMQGGMQPSTMNARDTSRSYMLQTMMPKMPMTGFDFPPGNGDDVVLAYDMLVSDSGATTLPEGRPWREIELTLSGNMQRFVWAINGKTLSEQDTKIMIRKGENVRVVFTNATMMEHPIHLHGHFFRVINNQGAYAPMKHTFNINAMATQVIEFAATEEKDWFLHCHTLYHMIAGMATIFSYEGTVSQVQKAHPGGLEKFKKEHGSQLFPWANASFLSQGTFGTLVLSGRHFQSDFDWKWNYKKSYELELKAQYFLDKRQFFSAFIGGEYEKNNIRNGKEVPETEKEQIGTVGLIYTLPFFINAEGRVDHRGKFRLQFRREDLPLTTRARLDFYWNTDKEYGGEARYIISKFLAVSANYDSDFGWGAGLSIVY